MWSELLAPHIHPLSLRWTSSEVVTDSTSCSHRRAPSPPRSHHVEPRTPQLAPSPEVLLGLEKLFREKKVCSGLTLADAVREPEICLPQAKRHEVKKKTPRHRDGDIFSLSSGRVVSEGVMGVGPVSGSTPQLQSFQNQSSC